MQPQCLPQLIGPTVSCVNWAVTHFLIASAEISGTIRLKKCRRFALVSCVMHSWHPAHFGYRTAKAAARKQSIHRQTLVLISTLSSLISFNFMYVFTKQANMPQHIKGRQFEGCLGEEGALEQERAWCATLTAKYCWLKRLCSSCYSAVTYIFCLFGVCVFLLFRCEVKLYIFIEKFRCSLVGVKPDLRQTLSPQWR